MTRAAVVIPAYEPGARLHAVLAALERQTRAPDEVIVVDSSPTPTPLGEVAGGVTVLRPPGRLPPGAARNLGVRATSADALVFLDADCVPKPDWLERILRLLAEDDVQAAAGGLVPGRPLDLPSAVLFAVEFAAFAPSVGRRPVAFAPSCNLAVRRAAYESVGGFPEDLTTGDDLVFCHRLQAAGAKLVLDDDNAVIHLFPGGLWHTARHLHRLGSGSARARRRAPLPGAVFARYPTWIPLVVPVRTARVAARLLGARDPRLRRLVFATPVVGLGLCIWASGFARTARQLSREALR